MSTDPKKGGQCWSCKYCEDIATQTNNPHGSYYRKCTKSGHEYVDICRFSCADYVWDGKHDRYVSSSTSKTGFKIVSALVTTAIFGFIAYLLLMYAEYLLAAALGATSSLPIINDAFVIESIIVFVPIVLAILWSIIRRRKIWIGALLTMFACTVINGMIGEDTTPSHIPLFIAMVTVPYLLCLFAILKEKTE